MDPEASLSRQLVGGLDQGPREEVVRHRREAGVDIGGARTVQSHGGGVDDDVAGPHTGQEGGAAADTDEVRGADVRQLLDRDGR